MTERPKRRLGELLIEDGCLSRESLDEALQNQKKEGGLIGQILIKLGYVSEEDIAAALGRQLKVPFLPLSNYSVNFESTQLMPEDFCRRNAVMIFDTDEKRVYVAVADPLNDTVLDEIKKKIAARLQIFLSTPTEIFNMLDLAYSSAKKKAG